jgi:phenylalanyl-tRNA synthetase beta chain
MIRSFGKDRHSIQAQDDSEIISLNQTEENMKFVKKYLNTKLAAAEAAAIINQSVQEVDAVISTGVKASGVITVKIIDIQKHPNADKLRIITVDDGQTLTDIATGAPNIEVGQIIALAKPGAKILAVDHYNPNFDINQAEFMEIKTVNLRGVDSPGMVCGPDELGISNSVTSGLYIFPQNTPLGKKVEDVIPTTEIIETDDKGTAHRPDLLSYKGIELELSAAQNIKIEPKNYPVPENKLDGNMMVDKLDLQLAACFCIAKIEGVKGIETPAEIKQFLLDNNVKLINFSTDLTNYIMLLEGVPTHAFDESYAANNLSIRYAKKDELITVLNGQTYKLEGADIVIANKDKAMDIAGIIGGAESATNNTTNSIILTAAAWNPISVRKTSRRLSVRTEASARFERGLPPQFVTNSFISLVELFTANGAKLTYFNILSDKTPKDDSYTITPDLVFSILGIRLEQSQINRYLELLGYNIAKNNCVPPYWRKDINCISDIIEDVARLHGYNNVPMVIPNLINNSAIDSPTYTFAENLRKFAALSAYEVKTSIFSNINSAKSFEVKNPIGNNKYIKEDNLQAIKLAAQNFIHRGVEIFSLFEITNVYSKDENKSNELKVFSYASSLKIEDAKSELATIFHLLKINITKVKFDELNGEGLISFDSTVIGKFLNHKIRQTEIVIIELELEKLRKIANNKPEYHHYSQYPKIKRDIAFIAENTIKLGDLANFIKLKSELITSVELFDQFSDIKFGARKQSLAFHITFQSDSGTLTDAQINEIMAKIEQNLTQEYKVKIREE